jgi:hypothetical protein
MYYSIVMPNFLRRPLISIEAKRSSGDLLSWLSVIAIILAGYCPTGFTKGGRAFASCIS